MKKYIFKYLIVAISLFTVLKGIGQNNDFGIKNFSGLESIYQSEISDRISEISAIFQNNGSNIRIKVEKVYPPSVYMNEVEGRNAMVHLSKEVSTQYDSSSIAFYLIMDNKSQVVKLETFYKIQNLNFENDCKGLLTPLLGGILAELPEEFSSLNEAELEIKNVLISIKAKIINGCNYDFDNTKKYLISKGFDVHPLQGMSVNLGPSVKNNLKNSRNLCTYIEYSEIQINDQSVDTYLNSTQFNSISKRVVVFSKNDLNDQLTLESVLQAEFGENENSIPNNDCDATFVLFFLGKDSYGIDHIAMGLKVKDDPSTFNIYTYNEFKEALDNYQIENQETFFRVSFKTHNLMKNGFGYLINEFGNMIKYEDLNEVPIVLSIEWYAGLSSGVIDGFIEFIDVVSVLAQIALATIGSSQAAILSGPSNLLFLADAAYQMIKTQSFTKGIDMKLKKDEDIRDSMIKFIDTIINLSPEQVVMAVWKMIKDVTKKLFFAEGVFEQGYTVGKAVFEVISGIISGGAGALKTALFAARSASEIIDVMIKFGKDAIAKKVDDIIRLTTTRVDNLLNIIKLLPNLRNWYLNGMNTFIKGELFSWSKNENLKHLILKLEDKLKDDPKFASYFAENGLFKMKAYKKLQMGFPNFNPCFH